MLLAQVAGVVDQLCFELTGRPKTERVPWAAAAGALVTLLSEYPTGVTWTLALAATQSALVDHQENASAPPAVHRASDADSNTDAAIMASDVGHLRRQRLAIFGRRNATDMFTATFAAKIDQVAPATAASTTFIAHLWDAQESGENESRLSRPAQMYLHERFYFLGNPRAGPFPTLRYSDVTLRMTGCRQVDVSRVLTARLLPTEYMLLEMSQSGSSKEFLAQHFGTPVLPSELDVAQRTVVSLALQVTGLSVEHQVGRRKRVAVYLRASRQHTALMGRFERVILQLWDDQTLLASLLNRGDTLYLYRPYVSAASVHELLLLEYGSATVLFVSAPHETDVPALSSESEVYSQAVVRATGDITDCGTLTSRTRIRDVHGRSMMRLSLFCYIVRFDHQTSTLVVSDAVDESDDDLDECELTIRLYGFDPASLAHLSPGSVCLVEGISVRSDSTSLAVCSRIAGGRIMAIDALAGVLMSPFMYRAVPLRRPPGRSAAVVFASLIEWTMADGSPIEGNPAKTVVLRHRACGGAGTGTTAVTCPHCGQAIRDENAYEATLSLGARLDDGFGSDVFLFGQRAAGQLLCISPFAYWRASSDEKLALLNAIVGTMLVASVLPLLDVTSGPRRMVQSIDLPPPGEVVLDGHSEEDGQMILSDCVLSNTM